MYSGGAESRLNGFLPVSHVAAMLWHMQSNVAPRKFFRGIKCSEGNMGTLGNRIKRLRKNNGLSQEELSNELGVSRQTVLKWENGAMCPNAESLKMLCNYFNVSTDAILSGEKVASSESAVTEDKGGALTFTEGAEEESSGNCPHTDCTSDGCDCQNGCKCGEEKPADGHKKSAKLSFTVLSVLFFVALLAAAVFTVICGFVVYSDNVGIDSVSTFETGRAWFYIGIVLCALFLVLAVRFCHMAVKSTKVK